MYSLTALTNEFGYIKIPLFGSEKPLIIQWGNITNQSSGTSHTYPLAFTINYALLLTPLFTAGTQHATISYTKTNTGFTQYNVWSTTDNRVNLTYNWLAIGF